jgi:hypothetical protein
MVKSCLRTNVTQIFQAIILTNDCFTKIKRGEAEQRQAFQAILKTTVSWNVTPCSITENDRRFGGATSTYFSASIQAEIHNTVKRRSDRRESPVFQDTCHGSGTAGCGTKLQAGRPQVPLPTT